MMGRGGCRWIVAYTTAGESGFSSEAVIRLYGDEANFTFGKEAANA
jgi:hypothetical protein